MNARPVVVLVLLSVICGCTTPAAKSGAPPATGVLTVLTNVCGAEVSINGDHRADAVMRPSADVSVAAWSLNYTLPAGRYQVLVRAAGYAPYKTAVRIVPGNQQPLLVRLAPLDGQAALRLRQARTWEAVNPWSGTIVLTVTGRGVEPQGAKVCVDGHVLAEIVREGEQKALTVPLGDHTVVVRQRGAKPYVSEISVTQRNPVSLFVALEPAESSAPAARIESTGDAAK